MPDRADDWEPSDERRPASTGVSIPRVGLLVAGDANRRYLAARLDSFDVVDLSEDPPGATDNDCDLVVVDEHGLATHRELLAAWRADAHPEYRPYLYLAPPADGDREEPAVLWEHVDDIIRRPVSPAELRGRVSSLLRARRYASELAARNDRLQELTRMLAHDVKNPLNTAMGYADVLGERYDDDAVGVVRRSLDRIDAIVDDVLSLATHDESTGTETVVDLAVVARDAWEMVERDGASLTVDPDVGTCRGTPSRVQELFENLFANAVEHGSTNPRSHAPEDGVEHGTADDGGAATVRVGATDDGFYVADDGPGVPESVRETVFESGYTTSDRGTGLGLAIVTEIADAHGWTLSVTDAEGGGARFEVEGVAGV